MGVHTLSLLQKFVTKIKLYWLFSIGLLIFINTTFFVWFLHKERLGAELTKNQINLVSSWRNTGKTLMSARWMHQRYSMLRNRSGNEQSKLADIVASRFLPGFTFGIQSDHFLIRNVKHDTVLELVRGALVANHSSFYLPNEDAVIHSGKELIFSPCLINKKVYVCLISAPDFRVYLEEHEQVVAIHSVTEEEALAAALLHERPGTSILLWPNLSMQIFLDHSQTANTSGIDKLFRASRKIDEGIWVTGSYRPVELLNWCLTLGALFALIIIGILALFNAAIARKLRHQSELSKLRLEKENFEQVKSLIKSVLHDIRSPLAALRVFSSCEEDPEKKPALDLVVKRITMIVSDLECRANSGGKSGPSMLPLHKILPTLILEKSKEHESSVKIHLNLPKNIEYWICAEYSNFCRTISNLVNNAVEATDSGGDVEVCVASANHSSKNVIIAIKDKGHGISQNILDKLFQEGFTYGKSSGSGLGLYSAKQFVDGIGGTIEIKSESGKGTTIAMELPLLKKPSWAFDEICLSEGAEIIIVDDDETIVSTVKNALGSRVKIKYFSTLESASRKIAEDHKNIVLIDNNFGSELSSGLDFISKLENRKNVILFTSDWHLPEIQRAIENLGSKLIGKDYFSKVTFNL